MDAKHFIYISVDIFDKQEDVCNMIWWLIIGFIVFLFFLVSMRDWEDKKKKEAADKAHEERQKALKAEEEEKCRIFAEKYGCSKEEMVERFRTSPAVNNLADIIRQRTNCGDIGVFRNFVNFQYNYKIIRFEELGLSKLPAELVVYLARALEEKLEGRYELNNIFGESCDLRRIPDKEDCTLNGW